MIEFCTKKRMLLAITFLGGLTIVALILESRFTSGSHLYLQGSDGNSSDSPLPCWEKEPFTIIRECEACGEFQVNSKSVPSCLQTRFRELVNCEKSGQVYRSCRKVRWVEERNFWLFETLMVAAGFLSSGVVAVRKRQLEGRILQRIERQLASGV